MDFRVTASIVCSRLLADQLGAIKSVIKQSRIKVPKEIEHRKMTRSK
jgi:hypothetical protein